VDYPYPTTFLPSFFGLSKKAPTDVPATLGLKMLFAIFFGA
jgi:hypothetical protein